MELLAVLPLALLARAVARSVRTRRIQKQHTERLERRGEALATTLGEVVRRLPAITTPTLVTHGRDDRLVSFPATELTASSLPNARLHGFESKGHLPLFTATREFCEVLRAFVRDVVPAA